MHLTVVEKRRAASTAKPANMTHHPRMVERDSGLPSACARHVRYTAISKTAGRKSSFDQKLKAENIHTRVIVVKPGLRVEFRDAAPALAAIRVMALTANTPESKLVIKPVYLEYSTVYS